MQKNKFVLLSSAAISMVLVGWSLGCGGCSGEKGHEHDKMEMSKSAGADEVKSPVPDVKVFKEIWSCSMKDYRGENTKDGRCPKCGMKLEKEVVLRSLKKDEIGKEYFCPVMKETFTGSAVTKAGEYKGKTYYFCCNICPDEFAKNPEKYIKKEDKQEKKEEGGGHHH